MCTGQWKQARKIDAHVHVVLHERENTDLVLNPTSDMLRTMDAQGIHRAFALPINYPSYFDLADSDRADGWVEANNLQQASIAAASEGRITSFADCSLEHTEAEVERSLNLAMSHGLVGLKIHPYNLNASADDARLRPWLCVASELGLPVVFHANPSGHAGDFNASAPSRVYQAVHGMDATYCIAHMGGIAYLEVLAGGGYVDFSGTLLWLAKLHGVLFCERLLRQIGIDRLLFATDYPIYPYEEYFKILDQMSFSEDEIDRIAWRNAERFLRGLPPAVHGA